VSPRHLSGASVDGGVDERERFIDDENILTYNVARVFNNHNQRTLWLIIVIFKLDDQIDLAD
jgi:hypothetical protein